MAKTDSKRLNVRLRTLVAFALKELAERWGCSQTAALERVVLEAHRGFLMPVVADTEKNYKSDVPYPDKPREYKIEYDEG
jgi:hypothetical protein